jgi:hypothetical protein
MSLTHTPGPWVVVTDRWNNDRPTDPDMIANIYSPGDEWNVAEVWGIPPPVALEDRDLAESALANARLIAAAPDLLAALVVSRGQWIHSVNAPQCLAAIAKAEGTP